LDYETELLRLIPLFQQATAGAGIPRARASRGAGITKVQMAALSTVQRKDNLTMSELAREMPIIQSAATRIVKELVARGLAERSNDPGDWRVVRIKLTPQGQSAFKNSQRESQSGLARVLEAMTPVERVELTHGLRAFLEADRKVEKDAVGVSFHPEREDTRDEVLKKADAREEAQREYDEARDLAMRKRRLIG
jgi:DNA-binding MarR family transcriptional regulator